jgi:hypothetical protein
LGTTDIFNDTSTTGYKNCLQTVQTTPVTYDFDSFVGEKVVSHPDGAWTIGKVQCLYQGITPSVRAHHQFSLPKMALLYIQTLPMLPEGGPRTRHVTDI